MAYLQVSQCRHLPRHVSGHVPMNMRGLGAAPGMGQWAQAVGSILAPLVEGGVTGFAIYSQQEQAKSELKQRQTEVAQQQAAQQQAMQEQSKQYALAQQAAIQQAQIASAYASRNWPYIVAALGIGALALMTVAGTRAIRRRKAA